MFWSLWLAIVVFFRVASALQVEVPAFERPLPVCVRDFVGSDQFVVINIKSSGYLGDGQKLRLTIIDTLGNQFYSKNDISGNVKAAFTTHEAAAIDICFTNHLDSGRRNTYLTREIDMDVESGSAARDWNAVQAAEKLKPAEVELRRIEEVTKEIASDLQYLKAREERMRDTNESTNARVQFFSIVMVIALVGLGLWQIQYLRHYFKVKHII